DLNQTLPERWKQGHREALNGAWLSCTDDSYIKSNGQVEWLDWDVRPWHDSSGEVGGILMQVDVTTQKKFEQLEYNKVSEIQKVMLDNTTYSMIATDTAGIITVFNKGAEKLLGYTAEEVIGKHSPVIFHDLVEIKNRALDLSEEFGETINPGFDVVVHKCKVTGEVDLNNWDYVSKDGRKVPISLSVSPMKNKDNEIFGYLGIAQDITTKVKYENKLIEAKERAVENSEMKSRFLANMSHEIRTPLNSIIGLSDLLSQESIDGEALKYIKTIHNSSEVLLNIVNDILDLSKIEANEMKLCQSPFKLKDAIDKIIGLFEWQLSEKRIKLFFDFDENLGEFYEGDEVRLHQVLVNLLGNALKFTLQGSVTLSVSRNTNSHHSGNIIFKVVDTGIGIPSAKLKSIFESFSQAESSTTKRFGGTGLGLSITKQLVDLMGGDVWVDSDSGQGSTFSFTVDMKQVESSPVLIEQEKVNFQISTDTELKVLLVDDAVNNRNLVKAFLKDKRYSIVEAQNGQEAFEILKKDKFDIVLMDMQMPVMDGFKATESFRTWEKDNGCGRTPVIALTAYALEEERQRSFNAGCDYHLAKPLKKKVLLEAIDAHVELLSTSA
ncbi:MAG: response regulator, partial [Bacteriovoracaceae bacterium]|nr:response regulator [Bacteriovoracaceae bacterium]